MHRLIMGVPLFGDIITILGILHLTIILFTIPTVGVIEIRITDLTGTIGDTTIPTTDRE
jgi:hypothetical protein